MSGKAIQIVKVLALLLSGFSLGYGIAMYRVMRLYFKYIMDTEVKRELEKLYQPPRHEKDIPN